jgi:hypothetical protein
MPGNNCGQFLTACPSGQVIAGSCGHRDFKSAMQDISIHYSGLYEANTTAWLCLLKNGNGSACGRDACLGSR